MSPRNLVIGPTRSTWATALIRPRKGFRRVFPNLPTAVARRSDRITRTNSVTAATRIARPSTAMPTCVELPWPDAARATTPRMGRPRVTNVLHSPTAVIAAVAAVGVTRNEVNIPNWTASPTAPPPGMPLLMANAA